MDPTIGQEAISPPGSKNLGHPADRFEQEVSLQLPMAQRWVEEAMQRREELAFRLRSVREPTVMIIGAR